MKWERCLPLCVFMESQDACDCACLHFLNWSLLSNAELLIVHPQQMDVAGGDLMVVFEHNGTKPGWRSLLLPSDSSIHKLLYWVYIPPPATSHSSKIITQMCKTSQSRDGSPKKRPSVLGSKRFESIKDKFVLHQMFSHLTPFSWNT